MFSEKLSAPRPLRTTLKFTPRKTQDGKAAHLQAIAAIGKLSFDNRSNYSQIKLQSHATRLPHFYFCFLIQKHESISGPITCFCKQALVYVK
jgi:hypothetical protein